MNCGDSCSRVPIFVALLLLTLCFLSVAADAGEVWREEEIGGLKYDHTYPFVVAKKSSILYCSKEDGGSHYDIWRMNPDGTGHVQLTDNDFDEYMPTSDENGARIVYTGEAEGIRTAYVMNFNGGSHERLIDTTFSVKDASISADGARVVFSSKMDNDTTKNWGDYGYTASIPYDIWKCDIDGSSQEQLTDHNWHETNPVFSPDGNRIVFVVEENDDDYDIHIMNEDGTGWDRQFINGNDVDETYPSFSPDGRYLLYNYRSSSTTYNAHARVYDLDTGDRSYLTADTVDEYGDEVNERIEGRYIRFCPPFEGMDNVKVIYSSKGDYGEYLRIRTSVKDKIMVFV